MRRTMLLLLATASFALTGPAFADPPNGDPPGCAVGQNGDVDNDPTGNGCPGGQGGGGGNGGGGGGGGGNGGGGGQGGGGGNANNAVTQIVGQSTEVNTAVDIANTNVNANSNENNNLNAQQQGQIQGQSQSIGDTTSVSSATGGSVGDTTSSSSSSSDSNSSTNNSGNSTVTVEGDEAQKRAHRTVATAYAPTVVGAGGSDSCLGSLQGGGQTGLFGISLGGTTRDESCRTIKFSRRAEELGMPDVACQILASDRKFADALARAGRTCDMSQFAARMMPPQPTIGVGDSIPTLGIVPVAPTPQPERGR